MYFQQEGAISTLSGKALKLVDQFIYRGNNISSIESDVNIHIGKVWTAIKIKQNFFQAVEVSVLLYGCTIWTQMKHRENAKREQHKNATCNFKHPGSTTHKTAAVQPLALHLKNHPSKTTKLCIIDIFFWTPTNICASVG